MLKKITNYEGAKPFLTKAEIDSYETMKTFATETLLKSFEKELVKSATKRQKEEHNLREKSITLVKLFQNLFDIKSVNEVEAKMRELAEYKDIIKENKREEETEGIETEDNVEGNTEEDFVDLDENQPHFW